jgi:hypothetical protein
VNDTVLATNNKPQYRDDFKFIVNKSLVLHLVAYFEILLQVYFCFLRFEKEKEQTVLTLFIGHFVEDKLKSEDVRGKKG